MYEHPGMECPILADKSRAKDIKCRRPKCRRHNYKKFPMDSFSIGNQLCYFICKLSKITSLSHG